MRLKSEVYLKARPHDWLPNDWWIGRCETLFHDAPHSGRLDCGRAIQRSLASFRGNTGRRSVQHQRTGALRMAGRLLERNFLLIYGDSLLPVSYRRLLRRLREARDPS
jgi:hypothetical protein